MSKDVFISLSFRNGSCFLVFLELRPNALTDGHTILNQRSRYSYKGGSTYISGFLKTYLAFKNGGRFVFLFLS